MEEVACLNGRFLPLSEACISVNDRGFLFGDSIYEVARAYRGRIWALDRHLERLRRSLTAIAITGVDLDQVRENMVEAYLRAGGVTPDLRADHQGSAALTCLAAGADGADRCGRWRLAGAAGGRVSVILVPGCAGGDISRPTCCQTLAKQGRTPGAYEGDLRDRRRLGERGLQRQPLRQAGVVRTP